MTAAWRVGLTTDEDVDPQWRVHLDAARTPTTTGQGVWDLDWHRWRGIALRSGRGQGAAIEVAYTRTEAQHGARPEAKETNR